jgi:hypothetical protein
LNAWAQFSASAPRFAQNKASELEQFFLR